MSTHALRPRGRSANIFISYRREDSAGHAGRLFDGLSDHFFGRLFMDVDTLEPGVDFVDAIEQAVGSCKVLIVIIGREWLSLQDAAGHRRLDNPSDFVRLEVESALARKIRVIPVLVEDATMPRAEDLPASLAAMARRNAIELSDAHWSYGVERLAQRLQEILEDIGPAIAVLPTARGAPKGVIVVARTWMYRLAAIVLTSTVVLLPAGREPVRRITPRPDVRPRAVIVKPPIDERRVPPPVKPVVIRKEKPNERARPPKPQLPPAPAPAIDPWVTITSPQNSDKVGERFEVKGTASGLGASYRGFLCFRQPDGLISSCAEIPSTDGGLFELSVVRVPKEKRFELLVVIAPSGEAAEALSDQGNGTKASYSLPLGATITGSIALKRQGWFPRWLTGEK